MKFAPNIFLGVLVYLLVLVSCGHEKKSSPSPNNDENQENPAVKSADSALRVIPAHPPVPDTNSPNRAKKKSNSDLDTLRPIKA